MRIYILVALLFSNILCRPSPLVSETIYKLKPVFPSVSNFKNVVSLCPNHPGGIRLFWNIENMGDINETLHMAIVLDISALGSPDNTSIGTSWGGIGFGSTMLSADITRLNAGDNQPKIRGYSSSGSYSRPISNNNTSVLVPTQNGTSYTLYQSDRDGIMIGEFKRYTLPKTGNDLFTTINIQESQDMIWAYSIRPPSSLPYHGTHRGVLSLNFLTGELQRKEPLSTGIYIHSMVMGIAWMVMFPLSIWVVRYGPYVTFKGLHYVTVHLIFQFVGCIMCSGISTYIFFQIPYRTNFGPTLTVISRPHSIFGMFLITVLNIHTSVGLLLGLSRNWEKIRQLLPYLKSIHIILGRTIVPLSFIQIGLGLNTLYPYPDTMPYIYGRGYNTWILFLLMISFWVVLFAGSDLFIYYSGWSRKRRPSRLVITAGLKNVESDAKQSLLMQAPVSP
jgi:hypothetical protein